MTIAFKGYIYGTQSSNIGTVDLTAALTGGSGGNIATDDLVLMLCASCDIVDRATSITAPSGVTSIAEIAGIDTRISNLIAGYKVMGVTPDTTFTADMIYISAAILPVALVFTGVDTTTPLDVTATTATGSNGNSADPAAITPTTTGALVLALGFGTTTSAGSVNGDTVTAYPSGYTGLWSNTKQVGSYNVEGGVGAKAWSGSGSEDPAAFTLKGSNTNQSWAAITIALRPAASGGTAYTQAVAGALAFSGGLSKQAGKLISGTLSFAGTLIKASAKIVAGSLSFAGALNTARIKIVLLAGALAFSGGLSKQAGKLVSGTLSFAGGLTRLIAKLVAGALSFAGVLTALSSAVAIVLGALSRKRSNRADSTERPSGINQVRPGSSTNRRPPST